jgi:hypothetical protein
MCYFGLEIVGSNPTGPAIPSRLSADVLRIIGVAFVRMDFVGSKREMSPNRARQELHPSPPTRTGRGDSNLPTHAIIHTR